MPLLVGAASNSATGYTLDNSLRFRASANAYLSRTPSSAGNRKTFTVSMWVKRGTLGVEQKLITAHGGNDNNGYFELKFSSSDQIYFGVYTTGSTSAAVFRDPSAWYHVVLKIDTTQASSANRVKVYINNTDHTVDVGGTLAQDTDLAWNNTVAHSIGRDTRDTNKYIDGYLTEINNVDGQALAPTDFGEYNEDTGVWQPKRYRGSYGTNGFYLKGRGTDNSGNGNNFTENNIDTSSGDATYDLMPDVPTLTDEDTSNFATLNPNNMAVNTTMTDGNLKASNASNHATMFPTIMPTTGKYYFECKMAVNAVLGLGFRTDTNKVESAYSDEANKYYFYLNNSNAYRIVQTTNTALGANLNNTTSTFQVAIDFDAAKYYFGRDNTWYAADWGTDGDPASGANPSYDLTDGTKMFPFVYVAGGTWTVNFGQQPFTYTPPTGFKKINTFNLPDSTIINGRNYFNTLTYTGNGSSQAVTGSNFRPDFLWIKSRSAAYNHLLLDTVRGAGSLLISNNTDAALELGAQVAFNSDGFSVGGLAAMNNNGSTYVGWHWKGGGASVSNTDGTITSSVSANPTAGFSIVTYTGNATSGASVGHGLGVTPSIIIIKNRDSAVDWAVNPANSTLFGGSFYLILNSTSAKVSNSNMYSSFSNSSQFYLSTNSSANGNTNSHVAYCFAEVEGYSKIGTYTGNGSADGTFVYTGFKPAFVLIKVISIADEWVIYDAARDTYNVATNRLNPNSSGAEQTSQQIDILSNGFKPRSTGANINQNAETYFYMAFAENPFKNSLSR
jgi:hypothetical protein